jgi:hypothetical protein
MHGCGHMAAPRRVCGLPCVRERDGRSWRALTFRGTWGQSDELPVSASSSVFGEYRYFKSENGVEFSPLSGRCLRARPWR